MADNIQMQPAASDTLASASPRPRRRRKGIDITKNGLNNNLAMTATPGMATDSGIAKNGLINHLATSGTETSPEAMATDSGMTNNGLINNLRLRHRHD